MKNVMNFRKIFSPAKGKLLLTAVFLILGLIYQFFEPIKTDMPISFGIPLTFVEKGCYSEPHINCIDNFNNRRSSNKLQRK